MENESSLSLILFLLALSSFVIDSCSAATVWSDDFDDGDYDGWVVAEGKFTAEEDTLKAEAEDANSAFRPSTVATGTWSFDIYVTNYGGGVVYFMWLPGGEGYFLNIPTIGKIELYIGLGETYTRFTDYRFKSTILGWQHFDITRDPDGRICVYHNGSLAIDTVEDSYTASHYFGYQSRHPGKAIDNIVVSNTVDILPPPPIPFYMQTWFSAAVGAVIVAVVIIVAYVELRKG